METGISDFLATFIMPTAYSDFIDTTRRPLPKAAARICPLHEYIWGWCWHGSYIKVSNRR